MSFDRYFYVTVGGIDMVFPDVVSKGVSLKEGGRVTLTTDLLSTSDLNSPDEHLVFTITRAPQRGHLECTDGPGMPISSFTQLQLAGSKVLLRNCFNTHDFILSFSVNILKTAYCFVFLLL